MKPQSCFVQPALSVGASLTDCDFSGRTIATRPGHRHYVTARRTAPSASIGGWRDAVFGSQSSPDSHHPSLSVIDSGFPTTWGELFLLGICTGSKHVYLTMQTKTNSQGVRSSAAPSSQALRIPLSGAVERMVIVDAFTSMYGTPPSAGTSLSPNSTAFAHDLLPSGLVRLLGLTPVAVSEAGASLLRGCKGYPLNRAEAVLELLRVVRVRLVGASVEEVASAGAGVQVRGFLFVEREVARLYGETVYHDGAERVDCDPGTAVAVANAARVSCYIRRELFDAAATPVRDVQTVFDARGAERVQARWAEEGQGESCPLPSWDQEARRCGPKAWELKAEDVLVMGNSMLRAVLAACDVGTTASEGRESLLRKVADWMDEVERRELGIRLAADGEMYALAGELQRGRSRRGQLLQEMRDAEEDGRWDEAVRIGQEVRRIESQTADITAEPGSYSRYLDQDDWYKPNR